MFNFLICLVISILLGIGTAILIVEKGKDWPIKTWRVRLQILLHKIHWKLPQMAFCTVCFSFWASLFSDIVVCILSSFFGFFYFFWPFSGIIACGIIWIIIEYLNAIDKDSNINVFVDHKKEEDEENKI